MKAASVTAIFSVLIFSLGRFFEQNRERKQKINLEKIEVYKKFFELYFDLLSYEKISGTPLTEREIMSRMMVFQKEVVLWGSDAVIKEHLINAVGCAAITA